MTMGTRGAGPGGSAPAAPLPAATAVGARRRGARARIGSSYPHWFYLPAGIVFVVIFVIPTLLSFWFSLTRWTLFTTEFIGLDNFAQFLREPSLTAGARNTLIYGIVTSGLKVIIGLLLGDAAHLAAAGPQPPALDHLLSGAGEHRGRRHHLRRADASVDRAHQPHARGLRHRRTAVAHEPGHRLALGGAGRRLEGRRHRHRDLHRGDPVDPRGLLRRRPAGGWRVGAVPPRHRAPQPKRDVHGHHCCRSSAACGHSTSSGR